MQDYMEPVTLFEGPDIWMMCKTDMVGWVKSFAIFWLYMLICSMYIIWPKQFKVLTVVSSIVVIGALTYCALLHYIYNLKAAQMNVQHSLILELMLYEFEFQQNAVEATKTICCAVDLSTVTRWFNVGMPTTAESDTVLQAIGASLVSSTWNQHLTV